MLSYVFDQYNQQIYFLTHPYELSTELLKSKIFLFRNYLINRVLKE